MKFIIEHCSEERKFRVACAILESIEEGASHHCLAQHYEQRHFYHDEQVLSEISHSRLGIRIIFIQER